MGAHLHRSQPRQAGKGRLSRHHQDKTAFPRLTGQAPSRNQPVGINARKGAVRKRWQVKTTLGPARLAGC